jgi:glutathione S-transferase
MSLTLHFHPLASFCWKPLIGLYENETPFQPVIVDLFDEASRTAFFKLWPVGKFPVLRDEQRKRTVLESTIIIEYLQQYYPGRNQLIPADPELAWQTRLWDRFFDFYVHEMMQKCVADKLRPAGKTDPYGVEQAKKQLQASYGVLEQELAAKRWIMGDAFTLADCAACPALFYGNKVSPFGEAHPKVAAYLDRLMARASFARVLEEAQPYFHNFPGG